MVLPWSGSMQPSEKRKCASSMASGCTAAVMYIHVYLHAIFGYWEMSSKKLICVWHNPPACTHCIYLTTMQKEATVHTVDTVVTVEVYDYDIKCSCIICLCCMLYPCIFIYLVSWWFMYLPGSLFFFFLVSCVLL